MRRKNAWLQKGSSLRGKKAYPGISAITPGARVIGSAAG